MKKLLLPALFTWMSFTLQAQQNDTTENDYPPQRPDPTTQSGSQPQLNADPNSSTNPLIRIRMDAIPDPMRKSLESDRYRGWEQSPVYRDNNTLEYLIDIRSGDSIRTFRFDKDGLPLESLPERQR